MKRVYQHLVISMLVALLWGNSNYWASWTEAAQTPSPKPFPWAQAENNISEGLLLFEEAVSLSDPQIKRSMLKRAVHLLRYKSQILLSLKGEALFHIGKSYYDEKRYQKALNFFRRALARSQQAQHHKNIQHIQKYMGPGYIYIGEEHRQQGRFKEAMEAHTRALWIAQELQLPIGEGRSLMAIGSCYVELGQYREAVKTYQEALSIMEDVNDIKGQGVIYISLGITYTRLGNYDRALENFRKAHGKVKSVKDHANEARVFTGIAGIYEEWGTQHVSTTRAISFFPKALNLYQEILKIQSSPDRDRAITLNNIAKLLDHWGWEQKDAQSHQKAFMYYQDALKISNKMRALALKANTLNNIGEVYLHLSEYGNKETHLSKAIEVLDKALQIQYEIGDRAREWRTLSNLGQAYELFGETETAINQYRQAIELIETVIESTGVDEFKIGLGAQAAETYQRFVHLLVDSGNPEEAFEYSERARARTFRDHMQNTHIRPHSNASVSDLEEYQILRTELAELEKRLIAQKEQAGDEHSQELSREINEKRREFENLYINIKLEDPQYASLIAAEPFEPDKQQFLKEVQTLLSPEITLLAYIVTPETTLAFIITHRSFEHIDLQIAPGELRKNIDAILKMPQNPNIARPQELEKLYHALIEPLKQHLTTPLVGIIPHGILHYLPFAALSDGKQDLIDDYTLFFLPAASALKFIRPKEKSAVPNVLFMANSKPVGLEPLPYSDLEDEAIARYYKAKLLVKNKATESAFKEQASQYTLLHLSAHGELNVRNPLFSRIVLQPDQKTGDDGNLEVHEIYQLDLSQTDLVVLSACDTKLGRQSKGDEIIGLNRAFLYAGASSVIASLWKVNDQATSTLMNLFYLYLRQGKSKAEALQAAQKATRALYPHPYYWAGFVLTGHPGE